MSEPPSIESLLPHRPPMLLVDEIINHSDTDIECRKSFRESESFFQGHFPDRPIVPGVILCECALQTGAALVGLLKGSKGSPISDGSQLPVVTRLESVRFKRQVVPGDTIIIHVELVDNLSNAYFMRGRITVDDRMAVRLEFACALTAAED